MSRNSIGACFLGVLVGLAFNSIADESGAPQRRRERERNRERDAARGAESEVAASLGVFDRVEAKSFVLRDERGQSRAHLGVDGDDVVRFSASSDKADSFLLSVFPDGRVALILRDERGRNRLALSVREDGRPVLSLSDNASVVLDDERGRNRAVLTVPGEGEPRLSLFNERDQATTITPEE